MVGLERLGNTGGRWDALRRLGVRPHEVSVRLLDDIRVRVQWIGNTYTGTPNTPHAMKCTMNVCARAGSDTRQCRAVRLRRKITQRTSARVTSADVRPTRHATQGDGSSQAASETFDPAAELFDMYGRKFCVL